ncbi:MAG: hypothetical protein GY832_31075 [Chloroflexi bacterium]|nr:hypothetical protein [Chloroflexota bacterium]
MDKKQIKATADRTLAVMDDFIFVVPEGARTAKLNRLVITITASGNFKIDDVELVFYDADKNVIGWGV